MSATPIAEIGTASVAVEPDKIAARFVAARLACRATPDYPGRIPENMAQAYAIQSAAIERFPDKVVGWKVGGVPPSQQPELGVHRLAGAIFARNVWASAEGAATALPEIEGGFAAVESEFIARIGHDLDPDKTDWSLADAVAAIDKIFVRQHLFINKPPR